MSQAIKASKEALTLYSTKQANIPLRSNIGVEAFNGSSLCMPGYVSGDTPALGVKIVGVYPDNLPKKLPVVSASMIVLNPETGMLDAIIDGTYLTQLRTGAVQGAGTDLLARKDAKIAALIGTGGQAMMQLAAMLEVRDLTEVRVFSLEQANKVQFVEEATRLFSSVYSTEIKTAESAQDAVRDADIITTVTTSPCPTFDFADVKNGTHINGIGAYTPSMCEIPHDAVVNANRIIFDTTDGVMAEAGDMIQPLDKHLVTKDHYHGELGQVLNGEISGRENDEQITIFKSVGSAVLDVFTAQQLLAEAKRMGVGTQVTM